MTNVEKIRETYKTKAEAKKVLLALKKLLHYYKLKRVQGECPICPAVRSCFRDCPWELFTGGTCSPYRRKYFPEASSLIYNNGKFGYNKKYRQARMKQLPIWIKYYEQALANWDKK